MRRLTTFTTAPLLSAAELTRRITGLRAQLLIANGEWADRIEGDIKSLELMLGDVVHHHDPPPQEGPP